MTYAEFDALLEAYQIAVANVTYLRQKLRGWDGNMREAVQIAKQDAGSEVTSRARAARNRRRRPRL